MEWWQVECVKCRLARRRAESITHAVVSHHISALAAAMNVKLGMPVVNYLQLRGNQTVSEVLHFRWNGGRLSA